MSRTERPRTGISTASSSSASVRPLACSRSSERKGSSRPAICGAENSVAPSALFKRPVRCPSRHPRPSSAPRSQRSRPSAWRGAPAPSDRRATTAAPGSARSGPRGCAPTPGLFCSPGVLRAGAGGDRRRWCDHLPAGQHPDRIPSNSTRWRHERKASPTDHAEAARPPGSSKLPSRADRSTSSRGARGAHMMVARGVRGCGTSAMVVGRVMRRGRWRGGDRARRGRRSDA